MLKAINCTIVTLIAKHEYANTAKEYRPIACCSVLYKIISKVITHRLQVVIEDLVNSSQSAFVPGKVIYDSIILSHELVKGYAKKYISPRCMIKVDLQKAYDSIDWYALKQILIAMGFPDKFINWIMVCLTTVSYCFNVNGHITEKFMAKRGLRQGDPLSPFFFALVMEYLSRELKQLSKIPDYYHPRCQKLDTTHLCFANDLLLSSRGDLISVQLLKTAFQKFSHATGLKANLAKSQVYCGGIPDHDKQQIQQFLNYSPGTLPIRYLGVPFTCKKLSVEQCIPLINKITARIHTWMAKLLSYADRLQMIKVVLMGMQAFWAQLFILPQSVIKRIEGICRSYLWT